MAIVMQKLWECGERIYSKEWNAASKFTSICRLIANRLILYIMKSFIYFRRESNEIEMQKETIVQNRPEMETLLLERL